MTTLPEPPTAEDGDALDVLRHTLESNDFTVEEIEERPASEPRCGRSTPPCSSDVSVATHSERSPASSCSVLRSMRNARDRHLARARGSRIRSGRHFGRTSPRDGSSCAARGLLRRVRRDRRGGDAHDFVPGIQSPSVTLAKLAVRRRIRRALDLGTGCGIQALLAAKHAEHVVATDVNPRALSFAAFNARLNGVENIEFRLGNSFEPVAGERFDPWSPTRRT